MERIAVIGCGGAGKTTLSRQLGAALDLPVVHIDGHYWRDVEGGQVELSHDEWVQHHRGLISADRWVIDGMKLGVLAERLAYADAVIYLDVSTWTCLMGVVRRRLRFRGKLRPDIGVYDRVTWEFIRWIWFFRRRQRPKIRELLAAYDGTVIVVRARGDLRRIMTAL